MTQDDDTPDNVKRAYALNQEDIQTQPWIAQGLLIDLAADLERLRRERPPYTPDQQRVVEYVTEITNGGIGGGDDPVGFLIASHAELRARERPPADAVEAAKRIVEFNPLHGDFDDELCEDAMAVARALLATDRSVT